jgi:hypothetical protein
MTTDDRNARIRAAMWEDNMRGRGVVGQHPFRDPSRAHLPLKRENVRLFDSDRQLIKDDVFVIGSPDDGWSFARITGFRARDIYSEGEVEVAEITESMLPSM